LPPRALIPAPPPRALIPPSPPRALMPPVGLPLTQAVSPVPTKVSKTPQGARLWWLWLLLLAALAGTVAAFAVTMMA